MADSDDNEKIDIARRRLMRIAVYAPPIVIGIVNMTNAGCAPASCAPATCGPSTQCGPNTCNPVINPCGPSNCNPTTCNPRP